MARDLDNRRDGLLKTVILRFKGSNPSLVLFAEDRFFENRPKLFFRRTFCRWRSNDHLFSHPCPEKKRRDAGQPGEGSVTEVGGSRQKSKGPWVQIPAE